MFDEISNAFNRIKLVAMVMGIWMIILSALRQWKRNTNTINETTIISSIKVVLMESIDSLISSPRSYTISNFTPLGKPLDTSSILAFTFSITSAAFSP
ncbi:hypothetical protein D9M68_950440 [compost metagenome]